MNSNRPTCARCAIKHLAQARALMPETKKGYPLHVYYAMGHMGEAEDELVDLMPDAANEVRSARLAVEDGLRTGVAFTPDWWKLMMSIATGAMLEETQREGE